MKSRLQYALIVVATALMHLTVAAPAANEVQNLAVVVNALANPELGISTSLSIVDLDEPDIERAVENEIIPLGLYPNDIEIQSHLGYVVNSGNDNVQIVDLRNRVNLGTIPIGEGTLPQKIAFASGSKAYVTCSGTNDIRVVDVKGRSVINTIPGGLKPAGITIINDKAYVTNSAYEVDGWDVTYKDSSVTVIDIRTDTVLTTIDVPTNATGITNDGESKVLVISTGDYAAILGKLVIIDANRDEVEKVVNLRVTPGFSIVINSLNHAFFTGGVGIFSTNDLGLMVYDIEREKWIRDRNHALENFAGGSGLAIDGNDNIYVAVPDWTGARLDELRVMAPDETLERTFRVGPGASYLAIARIQPLEPPPVDVNSDGVVDAADLVLVASNFGETGATGDVNADGVIDIFDLVLIAKRFGEDVAAAPLNRQLPIVNASDYTTRIQHAISELESYPHQSPVIRLITDYLQAYLTATPPTLLETKLFANFPNPFNPETWIPYHLAHGADVLIAIYDAKGALVRKLNIGHQSAGLYTDKAKAAYWDGKSETGELVSSGVYFFQFRAGDYSQVRRMAILK